jgi:hypothetical protein
MRIAAAVYLLVHGICHFVGFVVPWKLVTMKDEPYKTTLLAGNLDVGHVGIRIVGVFWLFALLGLIAAGVGAIARTSWWQGASFWFAVASLGLCILGLPGARIGIAANVLVLAYALGLSLHWLPALR